MHFLMQCLQMKPSGGKLEGKPCAYGYYLYVTQSALFFCVWLKCAGPELGKVDVGLCVFFRNDFSTFCL